jgi:hypothetical protein
MITKLIDETKNPKPLMAALLYEISVDSDGLETAISYNPELQITTIAGSRRKDFSTSPESESVWNVFGTSKSDTKKDD